MKLNAFIISLVLTVVASQAHANAIDPRSHIRNNYPRFEQILTVLNSEIEFECKGCQYGVSKKMDGYHLTYTDFETKEITEQLVWSAASGRFIEDMKTLKADSKRPRNSRSNEFSNLYNEREKFDFMLLYGYDNWAEDVINFLEPMTTSFSSEDLEILARAYNTIANQAITKDGHLRKFEYADFEDATAFIKNAEKSMELWIEIKKQNPNYTPLIIKDLDLKIGNEYMHFYNILKSIKMDSEAKSFLKNAWYPDSYIQSAKNLLYGCDKDGFLLTQGDSDTYPLWYVQEKFDYRKDVKVLNTSLLYTPWYMQMNKDKYGYKSILNQDTYQVLLKKGMYADRNAEKVPLKNWLEGKVAIGDTSKLSYDLVPPMYVISYKGANLEIKINEGVLPHNDLVIMDLISSNPQSSFNFVSPYQLYMLGLVGNYLERGKSFELTGVQQQVKSDKESIRQLDNLMFYLEMSYIKALKHTGPYELNFVCYGIQELSPSLSLDKHRLIGEFSKQLPITQVVKTQNFTVIESVSAFYSVVNPQLNTQLKQEAKSFISDRIEEISALNKDFDKDISDMEEIFSIYVGMRVQWVKFEKPALKDEDKDLLIALRNKVDKVLKSPYIETMQWSKLKLVALNDALKELELD